MRPALFFFVLIFERAIFPEVLQMKIVRQGIIAAAVVLLSISVTAAQAPPAGQPAAPLRLNFWVSSTAWPDGGVIPR